MPYLSLYRKYRPRSFAEVIGQRHVTQTLANAVAAGKIAHAYLFTGPRGTGKTSTARVLAMALNCERGTSPDPCGECEACRRIIAGSALDVIEIDAASNRSVEDMRELVDRVALVPAEGRVKVYIVDEVHMLTPESFNTFLKTLEEPPPHVVFVLATTEAHRVLPTIMSRCQRFDFRRIGLQDIEALIREVAERESVTIDGRAVTMLAHAADGAVRDALTLFEQAISYAEGAVTAEVVSEILGGIDFGLMAEFTDVFTRRDAAAALALIARVVAEGKDLRQLLVGLIGHYRNLLVLSVDKRGMEALALPEEVAERTREQAAALSTGAIVRALDLLAEGDREMRFTSQPGLLVELTALRICYEPAPPAAARAAAPATVRAGASPPPAQAAVAPAEPQVQEPVPDEPASPAPAESEGLADLRQRWEDLIAALNQSGRTRNITAFLREAVPVALDDGMLTLAFRHQFHHDQVANSEPRKKAIIAAIAKVFGLTVGLKCQMAKGADSAGSPQPKLIQDVLSTFPGSTVEE
jgi:DNA polymerase-3 subunit gamma/tau